MKVTVEEAMNYLVNTDFICADAKVNAERWKYVSKRKRSHVIITESGTGPVKNAKAEIADEVVKADDEYFKCLQEFEQMSARRKTMQLVVEVWRTEQANMRKG